MALDLEQEVTFTLKGRSDLKEFLENYIFTPLKNDEHPTQGLEAFHQILRTSPTLKETASELYDYITDTMPHEPYGEYAGYWETLTIIYDCDRTALEARLLTEHNICSMLESIIQETDTEEELFHWLEATLHEKKDILAIDEIAIWLKETHGHYTIKGDPFIQKACDLLVDINPDLDFSAMLPSTKTDEIENRPPFWPC